MLKTSRKIFWLNTRKNYIWIPSRLATAIQLEESSPSAKRSSLWGSVRSADGIRTLCEEGHLDKAVDALLLVETQGIIPSGKVYSSLLKACIKGRSLAQARKVQNSLAKHGMDTTRFLGESLVNTFVRCGSVEDAFRAFQRLSHRTVFSWTVVIAGYCNTGRSREALRLYQEMREEEVEPDRYAFLSLLKACSSLSDLKEARYIHSEVLKFRCESDLFVGACLVDTYGKCGSIVDAESVFERLVQRNVVSWTAMLAVYGKHGRAEKALQLYEQMREDCVSPDDRTFVMVLQACGLLAEEEDGVALNGACVKSKSLQIGRVIHAVITRMGSQLDAFTANTLISMYSKCGSVMDAQRVFNGLQMRDVISWNGMLLAYWQQGLADKVVQLYDSMLQDGVSPNVQTFICLLQAYGLVAEEDVAGGGEQASNFKSLTKVKALHAYVQERGSDSDVFLISTLYVPSVAKQNRRCSCMN